MKLQGILEFDTEFDSLIPCAKSTVNTVLFLLNGSYRKLKNPETGRTVIVPYHSKAMKNGLEQAILKQAEPK